MSLTGEPCAAVEAQGLRGAILAFGDGPNIDIAQIHLSDQRVKIWPRRPFIAAVVDHADKVFFCEGAECLVPI